MKNQKPTSKNKEIDEYPTHKSDKKNNKFSHYQSIHTTHA